MRVVNKGISLDEIKEMAQNSFGDLVKAVVDLKKGIMVADGELHADQEALLLKKGSEQKDLWGINLYPQEKDDKLIEFDSMINLRPTQKNMSRGVDDKKTRQQIVNLVNSLVKR